jgi:hypothetical protein
VLYQITAPHFTAALEIEGDKVKRAAPIINYMRDWYLWQVRSYCVRNGWTIDEIA